MTKREFIKICGILGISLPIPASLNSCKNEDDSPPKEVGKVLIIGAGAAGLSAAYLLAQQGIDFQILEAASNYGGRMKRSTIFADFPIPLGAEWLHVPASELKEIVNEAAQEINIETKGYEPSDTLGYYENGELEIETLGQTEDIKFIGSTWLDFFEEYIVPSISDKINLNTQIISIDYQNEKIILTDNKGQNYEGDKLIVTVPLKILKDGDINFTPPLPTERNTTIQNAPVWGGLKVFLEFSEKFYPTFLEFPDSETSEGQRLNYDAAYGQNTNQNILGLFAVGKQAEPYQNLEGDAQRDFILNELDEIFVNKASQTYAKHIVQNWNDEPYIRSAYLADNAPWNIPVTLSKSIDDKIFFAGEAYTREEDWSGVHNATRSAKDTVQEITG